MIMMTYYLHPAPDPQRGVLPGILGGGVPPVSPNPELISNQKMSFPTLVFRHLYNPYPFSDLV